MEHWEVIGMDNLIGSIIGIIIGLIPIVLFIIGCVNGTMRWVSFIFNLTIFIYGAVVGLIIVQAVPEEFVVIGEKSNIWITFSVSMIAFVAAILSLILKTRIPAGTVSNATPVRWVILVGGLLVSIIGLCVSYMYIYVPDFAQEEWGHMHSAVMVSIVTSLVGVLLVYLSSRFNSAAKPNLMRWLASGFAYFLLGSTPLSVALILIYAVPSDPRVCFPELSSLQMIAYLPYIFLFTMLAKDYQKPGMATATQTNPSAPQGPQTWQEAPQSQPSDAQTWSEPPRG
jgi:hypothetical protein